MTLLWLTLLLLHQGYTSVPVITAEVGQPVTLTCLFSTKYQSNTWIYWYKQSAGDTLNLIVMQQRTTTSNYGPHFDASRFNVTNTGKSSILQMLKIVEQDEGMYHCAQRDTLESTWNGTYLSIKGNSKKTSNYTVVQQTTVSGPASPTGSETLQCSVLSESESTTCSGEPGVFWFRAGSETSFPDMIYIEGKRSDNCDNTSDSQKKCFYNFYKDVSSSDAKTLSCAVATCGQILFANELNLRKGKTEDNNMLVVTIVAIICLVISVICNIVFICFQIQRSACQRFKESSSPKRNNFSQKENDNDAGPDLNYAALHFSDGRTSRGKKKRELMTEESVYSQVKGSA